MKSALRREVRPGFAGHDDFATEKATTPFGPWVASAG
jgi:hypothetical protein